MLYINALAWKENRRMIYVNNWWFKYINSSFKKNITL